MIRELASTFDSLKPIYPWQGRDACLDDQDANCLGVRDTKRFLSFIACAWRENWPIIELKYPTEEQEQRPGDELRFRDFHISRQLVKAAKKVSRFNQPSVYRQWC
jgi:hypothetical protein